MKFTSHRLKYIWASVGTPSFLFYFVAIWAALVMFSGIRFGDLSGYDDASYAHEAKEMLRSGDVWTLSHNGMADFDKPPLFIWLLALSFKAFGVNDIAAKIPGVVFGWATIMLTFFLVKELYKNEHQESDNGEWLAPLAMLCMATTQYFLKYASHAMTDVPFTFFFTLAIYFYIRATKSSAFLLASGIAVGLCMMIRSPIGIFPLAVILVHLTYTRRFRLLFSPYMIGCLAFAIALPATWYIHEYSVFGSVFVERHLANFFAHSASAVPNPAWQVFIGYFEYAFLLAKLYWPWFPFMVYGLIRATGRTLKTRESIEGLLVIWFCVVVISLSLADAKVLRYILPVFPALAMLSAYSLLRLLPQRILPNFARFVVLLLAVAATISIGIPNYLLRGEDMSIIAPVSDASTKANEKVVLYTSGQYQWNYLNQLLWYGNRLSIHTKEIRDIRTQLAEKKELVVIMDKKSFWQLKKQADMNIKILVESNNFVCFRASI